MKFMWLNEQNEKKRMNFKFNDFKQKTGKMPMHSNGKCIYMITNAIFWIRK